MQQELRALQEREVFRVYHYQIQEKGEGRFLLFSEMNSAKGYCIFHIAWPNTRVNFTLS